MKSYRELVISSSELNASELARYVEALAASSHGWEFPEKESTEYEAMCGQPSCCVIATNLPVQRSALHLTSKGQRSLVVTNVIPLVSRQLTVDEYNAVIVAFVELVRQSAKSTCRHIRVVMSKDCLTMDDVLPGGLCKKLFKRYLSAYPLSYHPNDIERLDQFTCALSRLGRTVFDLDAFQYLLIEEQNWPSRDAEWCRRRVEAGLAVLAANRKFSVRGAQHSFA